MESVNFEVSNSRPMETAEKLYLNSGTIENPCNDRAAIVHVLLYINAEITAVGLHRVLR